MNKFTDFPEIYFCQLKNWGWEAIFLHKTVTTEYENSKYFSQFFGFFVCPDFLLY